MKPVFDYEMADCEMTDYEKLIDEEVWAFINRTNQWYPADAVDRSIEEQRAIYSAMCREFHHAHPTGIGVRDDLITFDDANTGNEHVVPIRRYTHTTSNSAALIVYLHGGGFVVGDLDSHDDVCAELCAKTKLNVTAVDYRLSPEHRHPAAFEDCLMAVRHEADRTGQSIVLCGDSAGGTLCAAVCHHLRSAGAKSPVVGQVLVYPVLGVDSDTSSYSEHALAPMLTRADAGYYLQIRVSGPVPLNDSRFAPLTDTDFSNLPPTLVLSAECDPLSDDGRLYCDAIKQAGGQATWRLEPGLVHGYLRARHSSSRAKISFEAIATALGDFANAAI